ncbi:MAG: hypothetical protein Q8S33_20670 [Myxococcales bacterium]|nr:hypothetical protein [Myxococcales bacterium]
MKGLNVNGFIIVETLGSGRSGLLYLARHPTTGQEAILRLAGNAEDGVTAKVFLEEAASLLPSLRGVEPSVTSDGRSVLMARADAPTEPLPSLPPRPEARTEPLPQPRPGEGRTMHPNTAQLPVPVPGQPRRVLPLAMMFIGLAALGAGVTVAMLALEARPTPAPRVAPSATPSAPPVQPNVAAVPQPSPPEPAPLPVVAVKPTPPPRAAAKPRPAAAPRRECIADQQWRKAAQSDLLQHRRFAAQLGPEPFRRFELAEDAIVESIEALPMDGDCSEVDAEIDRLLLSVKPTPAPKVVCTPDVLWKRTMQNNLAEVEERANAMEPVDVQAEVRVIGAAVERAENQTQCEQAMRRFEVLLKRAIK